MLRDIVSTVHSPPDRPEFFPVVFKCTAAHKVEYRVVSVNSSEAEVNPKLL